MQIYNSIRITGKKNNIKCFEGKLTIPFIQFSGKKNQSQGIMTGWLT